MKYILLACYALSIAFGNAAERNFVVLTIDNKHDKPVEITYQGYFSQSPTRTT